MHFIPTALPTACGHNGETKLPIYTLGKQLRRLQKPEWQIIVDRHLLKWATKLVAEGLSHRCSSAKEINASVLYTDVEAFTALTEAMSPASVLTMMGEYFEKVACIVEDHSGVVVQFQGDACLSLFERAENQALDATHCAVRLQSLVKSTKFNGSRLRFRAGVSSGTVFAGVIGGANSLSFTIHGVPVNLASRLEQLNKRLGTRILICDSTASAVQRYIRVESVGSQAVDGLTNPVRPFMVAPD